MDEHDDNEEREERLRIGETAHAQGQTLDSTRIGALPILDCFLKRLRLEDFLRKHLPREDRRFRVSTAGWGPKSTDGTLVPELKTLEFDLQGVPKRPETLRA